MQHDGQDVFEVSSWPLHGVHRNVAGWAACVRCEYLATTWSTS